MNFLPPELTLAIYNYLNYKDILNLCQSNIHLANLCRDENFWRNLIYRRFPGASIPPEVDPKGYFKFLLQEYDVKVYVTDENYQLDLNDITKDQLSLLLDALLLVLNLHNYAIKIFDGLNIYTIKTRRQWPGSELYFNTEGNYRYEIGKLKQQLGLQKNIVLTSDYSIGYEFFISRNDYYISVENKGAGFYASRKSHLLDFIAYICSLSGPQGSTLNITQAYSKQVLSREWNLQYDPDIKKCSIEPLFLRIIDPQTNKIIYESSESDDPLWNIMF